MLKNINIKNQGKILLLLIVLISCKISDENKSPNIHKSESLNTIDPKFSGNFSVTQQTEETTSGTGYITYNFNIKKGKAILLTETYHEPIVCNGEYKTFENNNFLDLYYSGDDEGCKFVTPNFRIKKEKNTYFIQGVGGEATFRKWIQLNKTK